MPPALLLSACLARLATGSLDSSYALELKGEARERTLAVTGGAPTTFPEAWLQPGLELRLADRTLDAALAYRPELTYYDLAGWELAVLHEGALTGRLSLGPGWDLTGSASGSYGMASTIQIVSSGPEAPPGAPPTPSQPVPTVGFIKYVNGLARLGLDGSTAPTLKLRTSAELFVDGGADAAAKAQLPLEWGGRVVGGLDWTASPRGLLRSELRASKTRLESGWGAFIGLLTETWRFAATKQTTLSAGAGLSYSSSRFGGQSVDEVRPWGLLGLGWESVSETTGFRTSTTVTTEPVVDRVTGVVANRATAGTANTLTIGHHGRIDLFGSGGVMIDGPQVDDTNWSAEGRATWVGGPSWELYLGGRAVWSRYALADTRTYDWSAFLGFTLRRADHRSDRQPDHP